MELVVDAAHMGGDGEGADLQALGDLFFHRALGEEAEDFQFAPGDEVPVFGDGMCFTERIG
jgi:hypothetical protein